MKNKQSYYRVYNKDTDFDKVINLQLREMDVEEVRASSGLEPKEALIASLNISDKVWVVIHKGEIEGVFGVTRDPIRGGIPWFLSTDKFKEFAFTFAKESKKMIQEMISEYNYLFNFVGSRNVESIEWLRWLGFTVVEENPITYNNYNFYFFFKNGSEK